MELALEEARRAAARDEVPIGAVLVHVATGEIAAANGNRTLELNDPTAHAEILVIRQICNEENAQRIPEYDLYVTLEPCAMCAGALIHARIARVVYAASDPKTGAAGSVFDTLLDPRHNHRIELTAGVLAEEAGTMLREFFRSRR